MLELTAVQHRHRSCAYDRADRRPIVAAVKKRTRPGISDGKWRDVPWKHCPRDLRDELMDVYADLAEQLEEQDEFAQRAFMKPRSDESALLPRHGNEIFQRCMATVAKLSSWEQHALRRCAEVSKEDAPISPHLEDVCNAHGVGFFHLVMQYWAACIICYCRARVLLEGITAGSRCDTQIPNPQSFASAIARRGSRYFEPDTGLNGSRLATVPMGVACQYFITTGQQDSPEMEELGRIFRECKLAFMTCAWLRSAEAADPVPL
ncbi:hypothetical protein LTR15_010992 [Elasticomyces elasticus]|nr:hypothetical protein LTR15_010992 [Elasticomyces elasticus]